MRKMTSATYNLGLLASVLLIILSTIGPAFADKNRTISGTDISVTTGNRCPCCLIDDDFDEENSDLWIKSDWNADPISLNAWLPDPSHISITDGKLLLSLDNQPCIDNLALCHGQNFASGQYFTAGEQYRYGSLSAKILAGKGNGVITSMYLLGGTVGKHDEIDIEIFGKDAATPGRWELQTNYFRNGSMGNCWEHYGIPEPCHVAMIAKF